MINLQVFGLFVDETVKTTNFSIFEINPQKAPMRVIVVDWDVELLQGLQIDVLTLEVALEAPDIGAFVMLLEDELEEGVGHEDLPGVRLEVFVDDSDVAVDDFVVQPDTFFQGRQIFD